MKTLSGVVRYVAKVLRSCENERQMNGATEWAVAVITEKARAEAGVKASVSERRGRIIAPRVVICRQCEGTGRVYRHTAAADNGAVNTTACFGGEDIGVCCDVCGGSGRVIVTSEVMSYVTPYMPPVVELKTKE